MTPATGSRAPDFTARNQYGEQVRLRDFAGRRDVVLVFYPYAFSQVCTSELTALRDRPSLLDAAEFLAISCDPMFTLRAYADAQKIEFGLLSDFWPHGTTTKAYGVFDELSGAPLRSSFIVDKAGQVGWVMHNATGEARDLDEHARALSDLV